MARMQDGTPGGVAAAARRRPWGTALRACLSLALCAAAGAHAADDGNGRIEASFQYGQRLQLQFSEAMQIWDNQPDPGLLRLEPALPAVCTWTSDVQLDCHFEDDARPVPATRYRIHLAAGLKTQDGRTLPARVLEAETQRPTLHARIAGWRDGVPLVELAGDAPLTADAVAAVLRAGIDGRPAPLPPLRALPVQNEWDRTSRFALELSGIEGRDRALELSVVPGLRSSAGPLPGRQSETLLRAVLNERFRLRGGACAGLREHVFATVGDGALSLDCMAGEPVSLAFSDALDDASRQRFADALPAAAALRGWSVQSGYVEAPDGDETLQARPAAIAELIVDAAGTTTTFALPVDLRAGNGAEALEPARVDIRAGPYRPALRAPRGRSLVADGAAPPALVHAYNAAPVAIAVHAVGERSASGRFETTAASATEPRSQDSADTRRALAEGGWARWMPEPGEGRYGHVQSLQFAAPDFDLYAVAGRREVLVWANAWDGDAPVAGAGVELLWLDGPQSQPRVVATARTQGDGVALLHLPDGIPVEAESSGGGGDYPMWVLRATQGRGRGAQRAVLPAWQPWQYGVSLGQAAPVRLWGVADRPLYRAGDTVRYRLWQRQRSGGRLLRPDDPQPRELHLFDLDQRKTILRWRAAPGESGAFAGELALPIHLTDGTYCIGAGGSHDFQGTCFFVGTYRAQDLWVEARTAGTADAPLRDGDRFVVEVEAGYYSGGPAAGIALSRVTTMLTGLPLQSAYPQYEGYEFVDVFGEDARGGIALAGESAAAPTTDGEGRARIELPVAFDAPDGREPQQPAFGLLQLVAEARPGDREGTASNAAKAHYARHDRFVGLRAEPRWLDAASPVTLQGVVIDADGNAVAEAPVEVEVHYLPGFDEAAAAQAPELLARCAAPAGEAAACDFPRARSGRYRMTARSGDAAPAEVVRHVWNGGGVSASVRRPDLEILQAPEDAGAPVRVLLRQPHARARALFVFASGDAILGHRVEAVDGNAAGFTLPTDAAWRGSPVLHAHVREAAPAKVADGYRQPQPVVSAQADLPLPGAESEAADPVGIAFDAPAAAPGDRRTIVLRNDSDTPREVVLAVVDDALRALAEDFLPYFDPQGRRWLGMESGWQERLQTASFGSWAWAWDRPWTLPLPWPGAAGRDPSPLVFDTPSPMDAPAPPAPPAPVADIGASVAESATLDRIEVTGSRIDRADVFAEGSPQRDLPQRERPTGAGERALQALARVRTHFADAALWLPDLRLAPGETREIALTLPDNLTRWRAIAWSSDADDDFHVAEATLETGLPVEVRLQTPVRIYSGDRSRLAANLRQTGDAPAQVQGALRIEGLGEPVEYVQAVALAARGQDSIATEIAPDAEGGLQVIASADAPAGRDAVAAAIEVASPSIRARRLQAGWIGDAPLALDLPQLPDGAADARLRVGLLHGVAGLVDRWTQDLRAFPHRCWEQILSRAVGAALAIERGDTADWPDAREAIDEALDNAAVFQGGDGGFRFFADVPRFGHGHPEPRPHVALTAYALQAFALLRELGYPVDAELEARARVFVQMQAVSGTMRGGDAADELAFAVAAVEALDPALLDVLHARWSTLSLPARLSLAQVLLRERHAAGREAVTELLQQAPARGPARVLRSTSDTSRWMSSPMREQCALIGLLRDADAGEDGASARRGLIAGLGDLYAGGVARVDTQTGAVCLLALRDVAGAGGQDIVSVTLQAGDQEASVLSLSPGVPRADWEAPLPADGALRLSPGAAGAAPASYVAEVDYREDARQARASSVGFSIERRYEVLRDRGWTAVDGQRVREGDWLRITLVVRTGAPRHFVAVTDAVPGGLRPTDLALGGLAGLDLEQVSDEGSWWFGTRRLDPRAPRFYAEYLPAGEHALHYFARAGNGGDYLAAPASAELMYGGASNARTAARRIVIETASPSR